MKSLKRLLIDNVGVDGSLDTDGVTRAMLQLRNTPERDTGLSPAQVLMGRQLRDALPFPPRKTIFDEDSPVDKKWKERWALKEEALRVRLAKQVDKLDANTRELKVLDEGDQVRVQNQYGNKPKKWDRTGTVVQKGSHDQYVVKVHGSNRLTKRNRRFLRKIVSCGDSKEPAQTHTTTTPAPAPMDPKLSPEPPTVSMPIQREDTSRNFGEVWRPASPPVNTGSSTPVNMTSTGSKADTSPGAIMPTTSTPMNTPTSPSVAETPNGSRNPGSREEPSVRSQQFTPTVHFPKMNPHPTFTPRRSPTLEAPRRRISYNVPPTATEKVDRPSRKRRANPKYIGEEWHNY